MERLSQTRETQSPESAKKNSYPGDKVEYLKEKSERELEIKGSRWSYKRGRLL